MFYCLTMPRVKTEASSSAPRRADQEETPQGLRPACPHPSASEGLQLGNPGALVSAEFVELWVENLESEKPGLTSLNTHVRAHTDTHNHTHTDTQTQIRARARAHTHPSHCKYRIPILNGTIRAGFNEAPLANGVFRVLLRFYCVGWSFLIQ